ncbi:MAG: biopolymer transporter ExbD [Azospira oryzae]|jgi:biopolymer transport protein ExbD|nr:biopolymer transporter ExbD [Cytophaga sp.]PZR29884.1 MAG: biopolymer transporter ExbD [Azospira oryzae]
MAKTKSHRVSPSLDMTPMVDLAFLLVTFFMLTATAVTKEPIAVDAPSATTEIKIPSVNIITITVSKEGAIFFNVDGKYTRQTVIQKMGEKYGVPFNNEQIQTFSVLPSVGLPVGNLPQYLDLPSEERDRVKQPGIPADSLNNQLGDWVVFARTTNPKVYVAIKGDKDASYPAVKKVIKTLIDKKVLRFNLITNLEKPA